MTALADSIREKAGTSAKMDISQMTSAVESIQLTLVTKTITKNGTYVAEDDGADGFSEVTIDIQPTLQEKTVAPSTIQQVVTPDSGNDGLSKVTVNAVTAAIDPDIVAGNIKKNVEILGVTGTLEEAIEISGAKEVNGTATEAIAKGDTVRIVKGIETYTKMANPSPLPSFGTNQGYSCTFSPDGTRLAVGGAGSEYLAIYNTTTTPFTKISAPVNAGNSPRNTAFSPDGTRFVVPFWGAQAVYVYDTSTEPYTVLYRNLQGIGSSLSAPTACAFSPDGRRLAIGGSSSKYLAIYDTTTAPYTKLADPSTLPTGDVYGCAFSPDGTRLAVAHLTSPYITIYDTTTTPYTKLSNPSTLPTGNAFDCAFSPDGTRLAVAHDGSPYITIYDTTTMPYTKLADPSTLPTGKSQGCAFSPDGTRLAVAHNTSPYITIYNTTTTPYTKLPNPSQLPTNGCYGNIKFNPKGTLLAVVQYRSPFINVYEITVPHNLYKANNLISTSGDGYGYAKEAITSGSEGTVVKIFG